MGPGLALSEYTDHNTGLEDTEGVNRERAETHLRLVAEAELRRATTPPRDGLLRPPDMPGAQRRAVVLRRSDVVAALSEVDAFDVCCGSDVWETKHAE